MLSIDGGFEGKGWRLWLSWCGTECFVNLSKGCIVGWISGAWDGGFLVFLVVLWLVGCVACE